MILKIYDKNAFSKFYVEKIEDFEKIIKQYCERHRKRKVKFELEGNAKYKLTKLEEI